MGRSDVEVGHLWDWGVGRGFPLGLGRQGVPFDVLPQWAVRPSFGCAWCPGGRQG
jgi:hypothetical protein